MSFHDNSVIKALSDLFPEIGLDAMKMAPLLIEKAIFMRGIDMETHVNDAVARFEQEKAL